MPETLILPILALLLPGVLAFWLGRKAGRIWPGIILACAAIGWGGWLVYQAAGAASDDAVAVNRIMTAFGLAAPAAMSALVGMAFARFRTARTR
jgi:hypothetical protein